MSQANQTSRRFNSLETLYGEAALSQFFGAHIVVVGVGGVGSWTAEALARSGVGKLTLIDPDIVDLGAAVATAATRLQTKF